MVRKLRQLTNWDEDVTLPRVADAASHFGVAWVKICFGNYANAGEGEMIHDNVITTKLKGSNNPQRFDSLEREFLITH